MRNHDLDAGGEARRAATAADGVAAVGRSRQWPGGTASRATDCRRGELVPDILDRLDAAVYKAVEEEIFTDEINP